MTATDLLAELETLTHSERMRRMVELGQRARTDAEAQALLQALRRGDVYQRYLALMACSGSRDGAYIVQSLTEVSRALRGLALKLVAVDCSDAEVQTGLTALPVREQVVLLRDLLRHKRRDAVDTFLNRFAGDVSDEPEALTQLGRLLPFGSEAVVRHHLDRVVPRFGPRDWERLSRLHPRVAAETMRSIVQPLTEADARVRYQANAILPFLSRKEPEAALDLARELLRVEPLSQLNLTTLAVRRPAEVADLILGSRDGKTGLSPIRNAKPLTETQIVALLETQPDALSGKARLLRQLSPEVRRAVYVVAGRGWRDADGVLDAKIVSLLPGDARVIEARRCLALPVLATRPRQRLPYAAFLPWDEAKNFLAPSIGSPDAEVRSTALSALIGVARYDATRLAEVVALVRARKNEQDPVRRELLTALAALPPSRWQTEHLENLGQVIADALGAADLSPWTAREAEKLLLRLLPFHADWASDWVARLVQERGQVAYLAQASLSDSQLGTLAQALLPVLANWESRERESWLVQVARSLRRRVTLFAEVAPVLERIAKDTRNNYTASSALEVLREHFPSRFALLVPSLLQSDSSAGTLVPVYNYLHRTRQDLLTPYLGQTAFSGRFQTGKTRWVLPVQSGFWRWTPGQQEIWATTLDEIAHDESRDVPSVLSAVNRLALLPSVEPERLISLADLTETRTAVRDAALRALAHFDAGQGIPTLTDALNDNRARIAIYALRGAILEMPVPAALTLLRQVPTRKVTVAKEVVRLLGELKTPDAFFLLRDMARQTDPALHRDVRVGVLRGLREHLEQAETWDLFDQAAGDMDTSIAGAVVSVPAERLSPGTQERLRSLLAQLLEHPDPLVRIATLNRLATLPLSDGPRLLLPRLVNLLGSLYPDECTAAASAVFGTYTGVDANVVGTALASLLSNRRALQTALGALLSALGTNLVRLLPTLRAVLAVLKADPLTVRWQVRLAIFGLPPVETVALLQDLIGRNELNPGAMMTAVASVEKWQDRGDSKAVEPLETLEAALAQSDEPMLRRIALAALTAQGKKTPGWTPAVRARLEAYQQDADPLVAEAAQFTFPPQEMEKTTN